MDLYKVSVEKGIASLQTDNFAVLLVQGLESSDANILNVSGLRFSFTKYSKSFKISSSLLLETTSEGAFTLG